MQADAKSRAKPQPKEANRREAVINVRVPVRTRELIDAAAAAIGKSRSEFILESARQHATDVLVDRRLFSLPSDQFEAFVDLLDNPPPPVQKLKDLFTDKAPWDR